MDSLPKRCIRAEYLGYRDTNKLIFRDAKGQGYIHILHEEVSHYLIACLNIRC